MLVCHTADHYRRWIRIRVPGSASRCSRGPGRGPGRGKFSARSARRSPAHGLAQRPAPPAPGRGTACKTHAWKLVYDATLVHNLSVAMATLISLSKQGRAGLGWAAGAAGRTGFARKPAQAGRGGAGPSFTASPVHASLLGGARVLRAMLAMLRACTFPPFAGHTAQPRPYPNHKPKPVDRPESPTKSPPVKVMDCRRLIR